MCDRRGWIDHFLSNFSFKQKDSKHSRSDSDCPETKIWSKNGLTSFTIRHYWRDRLYLFQIFQFWNWRVSKSIMSFALSIEICNRQVVTGISDLIDHCRNYIRLPIREISFGKSFLPKANFHLFRSLTIVELIAYLLRKKSVIWRFSSKKKTMCVHSTAGPIIRTIIHEPHCYHSRIQNIKDFFWQYFHPFSVEIVVQKPQFLQTFGVKIIRYLMKIAFLIIPRDFSWWLSYKILQDVEFPKYIIFLFESVMRPVSRRHRILYSGGSTFKTCITQQWLNKHITLMCGKLRS